MDEQYKYKIGDSVNVIDGWERPIVLNGNISNRKRVCENFHGSYEYVNYYMIGNSSIYREDQLEKA